MEPDTTQIHYTSKIEEVKDAWLSIEKKNSTTVYQNYLWVSNWCKLLIGNGSSERETQPAFITIHKGNEAVAILPLCIRVKKGVRILSWLADDHFNYHGGLYNQDFLFALDQTSFLDIWLKVEEKLPKYHVLWLTNQLTKIGPCDSPFRWLDQKSSPNSGHQLVFKHHNWDELLIELRSKSTRKRMRNEESRLSREGNLQWKKVTEENELEPYLEELFSQREERFKLLGIELEDNISSYRDFYLSLLKGSVHSDKPFVYLMIIELDDSVLATLLMAEVEDQTYLLINSMTSSKYHKWSPGDYLLRLVLQDGCNKRSKLIDFGVSEDSNYKTAWCNTRLEMYETIKGRGVLGCVFAFLINKKLVIKRKIKQTPKLWELYCLFRSGKFKQMVKR